MVSLEKQQSRRFRRVHLSHETASARDMLTASPSANNTAWLVAALRDCVRDFGWSPHTTRFRGSVTATEESLTGMFDVRNESSSTSGFFRLSHPAA